MRYTNGFLAFALTCFVMAVTANTARAEIVYSSVDAGANGYVAFDPAAGQIAVEDYVMDLSVFGSNPDTLVLESLRFVGGVNVAGGVLDFNFYESSDGTGTAFSGFAVGLSQAGNFFWTIDLAGAGIVVPTVGSMEVIFDGTRPENIAGGGQIFISQTPTLAAGASPGNPFGIPGTGPNGEPRNFAFELNGIVAVPEPGSMGVLALCSLGLVAGKRLRRKA